MAPQSQGQPSKEGSFSVKGFTGGITSGLTKLVVGHPFDTIKVRLQCSPYGTYKGPMDCVVQLARRESLRAIYKGGSVPAVGWAITDSILMGSLHAYRLGLSRLTGVGEGTGKRLPTHLHALAGLGAGLTNSFFTNPIELIKSRLQMQHQRVRLHFPLRSAATPNAPSAQTFVKQEYTGPIDCARQAIRHSGVKGLWHALPGTLLFRANFAFMFGSYDAFQRMFERYKGTRYEISPGMSTFLSGGLAAEVYWCFAFPFDTVKNRMMADSLHNPKFPTLKSAFLSVWNQRGPNAPLTLRVRSFYVGFVVCLLRAFPTNAAALFVFETTMHLLDAEKVRGRRQK